MEKNILFALELMGKGMGSIFFVILILTFIVMLLGKITNMNPDKKKNKSVD